MEPEGASVEKARVGCAPMSRTCVDCGSPTKGKPRCLPCASADPVRRARISEGQRKRWAQRLADPAQRAVAVASGKALAERPRDAVLVARQCAGRAATIAAGLNPRCWLPPQAYAELNAELRRKRVGQADRKRIIAEQAVVDERRRRAEMSPFERQMEALARGAQLVERVPMPSREYDITLGGVGPW